MNKTSFAVRLPITESWFGCLVHLVDIYNMIEAFRENRLHTMQHDVEIHESKLEAVLSSIFYALNKRIPSTTDIDVEKSIALVKQWLLYAYDRYTSLNF